MRLRREKRGSITVEFGILIGLLVSLTIGSVEIGLLMWVRGNLQSVAALVARCGAIGALGVGDCTNTASTKAYAVSVAESWLFTGVITTSEVTPVSAATTCKAATGKFFTVSITSSKLANGLLPLPFSQNAITVTACYPMA
jgi:Flp pilus assembly protein TadG